MKFNKAQLFAATALPVIGLASPALVAQDSEDEFQLEEILVTAQKREQSLQDVPMSIQAVTGDALVQKNVIRLDDLDDSVPNLYISEGLTGNTLNVRGIGTSQGNAGFEQSVATFVDGVYIGRSRQSVAPLADVAVVEVLRGPQPVFFGQSAVGGALNITTRDGKGDFAANVDLSYGSNNEVIAAGGVTIPLSETLGVRIAGRYTDMDGWMTNSFTGEDWAGLETQLFRVTANWQLTEAFDIEVKYETGSSDQNGAPTEIVGCDPDNTLPPFGRAFCQLAANAFGDLVEFEYDRQTSSGGGAGVTLPFNPMLGSRPVGNEQFEAIDRETDTELFAFTWNYDFGAATLSGTSSYSEYDFNGAADIAGVPFADIHPQLTETYEQTSHEVRITSNQPAFGGFLDYTIGFYNQDTETATRTETLTAFALAFGAPVENVNGGVWSSEDRWTSVFASLVGNFSDNFRGNLGLRYTDVRKDGNAYVIRAPFNLDGPLGDFAPLSADPALCDDDGDGDGFVTNVCENGFVDTDDLSFQIGFEYDSSDDVMWFGSYTQAFKAGGVSQVLRGIASREGVFTFDDEESKSFELGLKSKLMDKRLRLNANLFYTDYANLQVSSYNVNTESFNVRNAAAATSKGFEFDGEFLATERLSITFAGSLLDAEYDSFPGAQCSQYEQFLSTGDCYFGPPQAGDPDGDGNITDREGFPLLFAPDFTVNLGFRYTVPVSSSHELTFGGDFMYMDDHFISDRYDPRETGVVGYGGLQTGFERVNLRIEFADTEGGWSVAAYGNNITDPKNSTLFGSSQFNGAQSGFIGATRGSSYGVQLRANF